VSGVEIDADTGHACTVTVALTPAVPGATKNSSPPSAPTRCEQACAYQWKEETGVH